MNNRLGIEKELKIGNGFQDLMEQFISLRYNVSFEAIKIYNKNIPPEIDLNVKSELLTIDRILKIKKIKNKIFNK